jgi:hypothetical protein
VRPNPNQSSRWPHGEKHELRCACLDLTGSFASVYASGIPEEKIERPTGLPKGSRAIGNNPRCPQCKAKGAVECATCAGSGLYVDAVLESQGIIVKVRCLGACSHLSCIQTSHLCAFSLRSGIYMATEFCADFGFVFGCGI